MQPLGFSNLVQLAFILGSLIVLPWYYLRVLWQARLEPSSLTWWLRALYSAGIVLFLFVAGPWEWVSHYLRYAWLLLAAVLLVRSWRGARGKPFRWPGSRAWSDVLSLLFIFALLAISLRGYFVSDEPVRLAFPLRDGTYVVGQGGNSPLINYHNAYESQKYALDILALNAVGARAVGLYPSEPSRYAIFDHQVYSPCDGRVTKAVDGLPDLNPPEADRENRAGNHVVIACEGVNVVLAHLRQGSVSVSEGETVATGQPLGAVGNSGNTTEPHLHLHAVRADDPAAIDGEGVPILFDGRFLVRNAVVRP